MSDKPICPICKSNSAVKTVPVYRTSAHWLTKCMKCGRLGDMQPTVKLAKEKFLEDK